MSYQNFNIERTNKLAIASVVLGVVGVLVGWCTLALPSIAAIVTGHMALSQIKRTRENGRGLAIAGLVMGYLSLLGTIILLVLSIAAGAFSFEMGDYSGFQDDLEDN